MQNSPKLPKPLPRFPMFKVMFPENESFTNHKNDSSISGLMSETVAGIQSQIETLKNDVIEASSKIPSEVTLVTIKDQGMVQKRHYDVINT